MLQWRNITIEDRKFIEEYLGFSDQLSYVYFFGSLYLWKDYFKTQLAEEDNTLYIKLSEGYLFPLGADSKQAASSLLESFDTSFCFVDEKEKAVLESLFPCEIEVASNRNRESYIYSIDDLSNLPGSKYQEERRKVHKFQRDYEGYSFGLLGEEDILQCEKLYSLWKAEKEITSEDEAMNLAFTHRKELDLMFFGLKYEGKLIAFDVSELSYDGKMVDLHFEKADYSYKNVYAALRFELANYIKTTFPKVEYINYEDDFGVPGLRNWKTQYHPCIMWPSYVATRRAK